MRKTIFTVLAVLLIGFTATSQNTFNKGDNVLNLGIGIGSTLYSGTGYSSKIPPISASYEVGVIDELFDEKSSLGVGGYLGYTSSKWEYMGWGWNYSSTIIGGRGALHYQLIDKLDTYTGLMIGYNVVSSKSFGTQDAGYNYSTASSGLSWSWFLGGRYYFKDNIAGLAELGYGISYLTLGVAFKL